jgi:hypothetical protein
MITPIGEMAEYRQRVNNTDGVEWNRCLCRILRFPFNLRLNTRDTHENILVLVMAQEKNKKYANVPNERDMVTRYVNLALS